MLLAFSVKNRYKSQANVSLITFYKQLNKREKLLLTIDKPGKQVTEMVQKFEQMEKQIAQERFAMEEEDRVVQEQRRKEKLQKRVFGKKKA